MIQVGWSQFIAVPVQIKGRTMVRGGGLGSW